MLLRKVPPFLTTGLFLITIVLGVVLATPAHSLESSLTRNAVTSTAAQATALVPSGLESISVGNASRIAPLGRLGRGRVVWLAWSPDGKTVAVASSVGVWLYTTDHLDAEPRLLPGYADYVLTVAFSPDGKVLASGGWDNTVRLWAVPSGQAVATLTPREEKVLRMRFGIGEKSDHTLEEVGQDFEVTRERIRQIEAKALRKLRHPSRSKRLKSFVES